VLPTPTRGKAGTRAATLETRAARDDEFVAISQENAGVENEDEMEEEEVESNLGGNVHVVVAR